jgi:hypothetical protein
MSVMRADLSTRVRTPSALLYAFHDVFHEFRILTAR